MRCHHFHGGGSREENIMHWEYWAWLHSIPGGLICHVPKPNSIHNMKTKPQAFSIGYELREMQIS